MNNLIVVPARGGSKGIHLKNITLLKGKPLLYYTLDIIGMANLPNTDIVVSSDSDKILEVASKFNSVTLIKRPQEIATDNSSTETVLLHAIETMGKQANKVYDTVMTLQPTSPLRKAETLVNFYHSFVADYNKYDAQLSLSASYSDYWVKKDSGEFSRLYPEAPRRRQERNPIYVENSAYYITKVSALIKYNFILGEKTKAFIISDIEGIDINEPVDLKIAASYL